MLIAFAALATFIFCVLFGSRRTRTVALQLAASIALAGIVAAPVDAWASIFVSHGQAKARRGDDAPPFWGLRVCVL